MSAAVSLRLPARPENVAVVRQALTGLGDAYDLDPDLLGDVKTAVTEACNNVVLHAYEETDDGLVEIEADSDGTGARRGRPRLRRRHPAPLVRRRGAHARPRPAADRHAFAQLRDPRRRPNFGLEVDMVFAAGGVRAAVDALAGAEAPRVGLTPSTRPGRPAC